MTALAIFTEGTLATYGGEMESVEVWRGRSGHATPPHSPEGVGETHHMKAGRPYHTLHTRQKGLTCYVNKRVID